MNSFASTEPRGEPRGEAGPPRDRIRNGHASTEPRGEPRGEPPEERAGQQASKASTEPRGEPRGEWPGDGHARLQPRGFNGATRRTAWRASRTVRKKRSPPCFNGATRRTAWRDNHIKMIQALQHGFNGATRRTAWRGNFLWSKCMSEIVLQRSHAANRVERDGLGLRVAVMKMLQRSHAANRVESRLPRRKAAGIYRLQRSHAANRVESPLDHIGLLRRHRASTEPRGEPRGELAISAIFSWMASASTEPRGEPRGEPRRRPWCGSRAIRFNGATRRTAWRGRDSSSSRARAWELQRSHAANRVESWHLAQKRDEDARASTEPRGEPRGEWRPPCSSCCGSACFNGATRRTAWRADQSIYGFRGARYGFNGATRRTAWRVQTVAKAAVGSAALQRSHAANRVESQDGEPKSAPQRHASTEPRGEPRGEGDARAARHIRPQRFNGATRRTAWRAR